MAQSAAAANLHRAPGWLGGAALLVFALLVLLAHLEMTVRRPDRALLTYDSAEYAIAGRHLARTGTLATWFVHPDELVPPRRPPFPMIVGHPLVPMLDAAVFAVGGAQPVLTLIPAGLCFLLLVGCAAALGRRVGGSSAAGVLAGAAVAVSAPVLLFATEGLSEIPFTAAWMGALVLLWDSPQRPRAFALGLVLGIAHLARPIMVPMLPAWLLGVALAAAPRTRVRAIALALLGFLVCAVPLALYKAVAAGNPLADVARYNLLSYLSTELDPVRIHRMIEPPAPLPYLVAHANVVLAKVQVFLPQVAWDAIGNAGVVFAGLFLLWLWPTREPNEKPFRITVATTFVLFIVLVTLTLPNRRYLFPLVPVLLAIGIGQAWRLATRLRASRPIAILVCAVLLAISATPLLRTWTQAWPAGLADRGGFSETEWRDLGRGLAERLPAGAVSTSDIGPQIAWYAERASVLIPNTPEEVADVDRRLHLDAIVLTNHWLIGQPGSEGWKALFFGARGLAGWAPTDTVEAGRLKAIVFTRTP